MPWIVPRATARLTSRLAWTAPKRLSIWRSSIVLITRRHPGRGASRDPGSSATEGVPLPQDPGSRLRRVRDDVLLGRALPVHHVVVHLDLAVLDVGGRGLDRAAHLGRDERLVVLDRSEERRVGKECRSRWSPY